MITNTPSLSQLIDFNLPQRTPFHASHKKAQFAGICPVVIIDWRAERAKVLMTPGDTVHDIPQLRWYGFHMLNIKYNINIK